MPSLTIKNLPKPLYDRLKREAKRHRRSLNSEVIACLERVLQSTRVDTEAFLQDLRRLQNRLKLETPLTQDLIDAARQEGRP